MGGLCVAVTGASGDLGALLLPLLEQDERVERILAVDAAKPTAHGAKVQFRRVELSQPGADSLLASALIEAEVTALYHLAFIHGRIHSGAFAHELEVVGSMHTLSAAKRAGIQRLIVPSLTALYGARPQNPALLREDAPLRGCDGSRYLNDKVQVEQQLEDFRRAHPEVALVVLRFAPIVGPSVDNPVTRWLRTRVVPSLLGFDPLWQVIHEEDAAAALHRALFGQAVGAFNVVGRGVMSFSGLVRETGGAVVPLPQVVVRAAIRALEATGIAALPEPMLDFIHYSWVADGRRAHQELGFSPRHHAKDAAASIRGS